MMINKHDSKETNVEELIKYIFYNSSLSNEQLGNCTVSEIVNHIERLVSQVRRSVL